MHRFKARTQKWTVRVLAVTSAVTPHTLLDLTRDGASNAIGDGRGSSEKGEVEKHCYCKVVNHVGFITCFKVAAWPAITLIITSP